MIVTPFNASNLNKLGIKRRVLSEALRIARSSNKYDPCVKKKNQRKCSLDTLNLLEILINLFCSDKKNYNF